MAKVPAGACHCCVRYRYRYRYILSGTAVEIELTDVLDLVLSVLYISA